MEVEIVETKECSFCFKYIDARASRCPHCCSVLQRPKDYKRWSQVAGFLVVVMTLISFAGWNHALNKIDENRTISEEMSALSSIKEDLVYSLDQSRAELEKLRTKKGEVEIIQLHGELDLKLVSRLISCKALITDLSCSVPE